MVKQLDHPDAFAGLRCLLERLHLEIAKSIWLLPCSLFMAQREKQSWKKGSRWEKKVSLLMPQGSPRSSVFA